MSVGAGPTRSGELTAGTGLITPEAITAAGGAGDTTAGKNGCT